MPLKVSDCNIKMMIKSILRSESTKCRESGHVISIPDYRCS